MAAPGPALNRNPRRLNRNPRRLNGNASPLNRNASRLNRNPRRLNGNASPLDGRGQEFSLRNVAVPHQIARPKSTRLQIEPHSSPEEL